MVTLKSTFYMFWLFVIDPKGISVIVLHLAMNYAFGVELLCYVAEVLAALNLFLIAELATFPCYELFSVKCWC